MCLDQGFRFGDKIFSAICARPFSDLIRQLTPRDALTWLRVRLECIGRMGDTYGMEVAQRFEEWR